jgi:Putative addiction module component
MARAVSEIETETRALDPNDQEQLLWALLEELDGAADPDVDRAWLDEARRRSRELDFAAVEPIPALAWGAAKRTSGSGES